MERGGEEGDKCSLHKSNGIKKIIATPKKMKCFSSRLTHLMDKVLQLSLLSPEGDLLLKLAAWWNAGWGKQSINYYT